MFESTSVTLSNSHKQLEKSEVTHLSSEVATTAPSSISSSTVKPSAMASVISTGCTLHSRAGAGKAAEEVQVRVTRSPEVALLGPDTSTVEGRSGEASGEEVAREEITSLRSQKTLKSFAGRKESK